MTAVAEQDKVDMQKLQERALANPKLVLNSRHFGINFSNPDSLIYCSTALKKGEVFESSPVIPVKSSTVDFFRRHDPSYLAYIVDWQQCRPRSEFALVVGYCGMMRRPREGNVKMNFYKDVGIVELEATKYIHPGTPLIINDLHDLGIEYKTPSKSSARHGTCVSPEVVIQASSGSVVTVLAARDFEKGAEIEVSPFAKMRLEKKSRVREHAPELEPYLFGGKLQNRTTQGIALGHINLYVHDERSPNLCLQIDNRTRLITVKASRDIRKGEELTYDHCDKRNFRKV